MKLTKPLTQRFKNIKLLILDVDGVLTKGEIIYDDKGHELKIFNVKDGLGIHLLSRLGIPTVLLSARNSPVLKKRANDMRVAEVIAGALPKEAMLTTIAKKYRVSTEEMCFVGDDLIDLGVIKQVGVGVAVNNAPIMVKKAACYITSCNGGEGAVREIVDIIILAKKWQQKLMTLLKNPAKKSKK